MKLLRVAILLLIIYSIYSMAKGDLFNQTLEQEANKAIDRVEETFETLEAEIDKEEPQAAIEESESLSYEGSLYQWIGKSEASLVDEYGEPNRKDASAYGYTWWIYNQDPSEYLQFGVEDGKVVTWFATGKDMQMAPYQLGQTYDEVNGIQPFNEEIKYKKGIEQFTFQLTEEDRKRRPLIKLSDSVFAQLYFDTFTEELSSVRVLTSGTLLKHQPYKVMYRGELPEKPVLLEEEWTEVQKGREQQVFDITNVIRHRFGKSPVVWDEGVASVAFNHSQDMNVNNYFSHYSQNGDGLKERLATGEVRYVRAGENIAAQYPDGPAAVEGWLNSEGHREALLFDQYTHLGVGVYKDYYTQNFLTLP
ncbi:CAP domain-containing protein [Thalassobacillus hwangdonensis]|uniref:CAP domain-containing protein n=1 Tax=Thalassobacillus hwangdonensis TaxID=546108 RepID=A0ABW3KYA0_9BACI